MVHDLNKDPSLPFPDAAFDAVICAVSIDYMKRPREVLAEVRTIHNHRITKRRHGTGIRACVGLSFDSSIPATMIPAFW